MKKHLRFLLIFCLLFGMSGMKAQTISYYFIKMPVNLIPTVSVDTRRDLVDFYDNGKSAVMPSAFGSEVVLKEMSEDYLLLQTSANADLQLKLLQVNDSLRVIALVQTVVAPLKDSRISFYSTTWQPISKLELPQLSFLDFLDVEKGKALGLENRFNEVGLRNFVSYQFSKNKPVVVAHSSIREDIRPEVLKEFEPIIKDSITFVFQNGCFNLLNPEK
ncbi:MAG: DUF3256 family protein [Bacteroidales bacterium]|nr:DUF3256 family protein [Bacteroidales bacterium]